MKVYSLNAAYNNVTFNGTTTQPLTAGNWTDVVTSGGGTISKDSPLVMGGFNGGSVKWAAIEIDGKILLNPFLWSAQVYSSDATTIDWDTTSIDGFAASDPGGFGRKQMFDGNAAGSGGSNGQPDSQSWVAIFRPNTPINVTSLRIAPNSSSAGAQFPVFVNGDNTTPIHTLTGGGAASL